MAPGDTPLTRTSWRKVFRQGAGHHGEPGFRHAVNRVVSKRPLCVYVNDINDDAVGLRVMTAPQPVTGTKVP